MSLNKGQARALVRLLAQDLASRIGDTAINEIIHDAHVHYRRMNNHRSGTWPGMFGIVATDVYSDANDNTSHFWTDILHVFRETNSTDQTGVEMERVDFQDIIRLQVDEPTPGPPRLVSVVRFDRGGASISSDPIQWRLFPWPVPDTSYWFSVTALTQPDTPTSFDNSTDGQLLIVPDDETTAIVRDAAVMVARLLGRSDEFVEGIRRAATDRAALGRMWAERGIVRRGQDAELAR